MAKINDPNVVRSMEDDFLMPEPDDVEIEIYRLEMELFDAVEHVENLRAEIKRLRDENAYLRAMSSSGFARGTIKRPPIPEWTPADEPEDLL